MGVYEENIVPIKVSRLAEYVSHKKHLSLFDALLYIYSNPLYKEFYREESKWWYLSTEALFDEMERRRLRSNPEQSVPAFEFFVYTMEMYSIKKKIGGLYTYALFNEYGVDKFLMEHYELLHTQGIGYVLDEIDLFLKARKNEIVSYNI